MLPPVNPPPLINTFWTPNGNTDANRLISPTPGDALTPPVTILPGSDGVDYTNAEVWINARTVFNDTVVDPATGQTLFAVRPANFANPTVADFTVWHSRHQVDFILEEGLTEFSPPAPNSPPDPLPPGTRTVHHYTFTNGPTFALGQDGRTVYNIEGLTFAEIATMPFADQEALAGLPVFQARAAELLLRPLPGETVADVRAELIASVDAVIVEIESTTNYDAGDRDAFLQGFLFDATLRVEFYPHFFVEQLKLYKLRLEAMALFSPARVTDFLTELRERFNRVKSYHDITPEVAVLGALTNGVNALDAGKTLSTGLGIFIEMESQLFQIALARAYLTTTGTLVEPIEGKLFSTQAMLEEAVGSISISLDVATGVSVVTKQYKDYSTFLTEQATDIYGRITAGTSQQRFLDGPNLIFVLQTFSNYEAEAEAQIKSEELNQETRLLQDYSAMQKLINDTLSQFQPEPDFENEDAPAETLAFLNLVTVSQLTPEQQRIAAMFDTTASAGNSNSFHPVEAEKSTADPPEFRPTVVIAVGGALQEYQKSVWDQLAIAIGESTKLISQDSQIQMDAINKLSQQKNRHYELGSNVLNKVTELLRDLTSS